MTRSNLQILFTALGFFSVVLKGENTASDGAFRAVAMSDLIREFCQTVHPEFFADNASIDLADIDQLIEELKEEELHTGPLSRLSDNPKLLSNVYDRLVQRYKAYATTNMIVGEIAHFVEEEVHHKAEADMMIVNVQGDKDFLTPAKEMASDIVEILTKNGECYPEDLKAKGFSPEKIKRHWPMAYALAKVELNWTDA